MSVSTTRAIPERNSQDILKYQNILNYLYFHRQPAEGRELYYSCGELEDVRQFLLAEIARIGTEAG
jgi:hypothetical protein